MVRGWLSQLRTDGVNGMKPVVLAYLVCLSATHDLITDPVRIGIVLAAIPGLVWPALLRRPLYWFSIGLILAIDLIPNYSHAANHYWLTVYTTFLVGIHTHFSARGGAPSLNLCRVMMIVTFAFATLHKLLSSYFMSGRLLGHYMLDGEVGTRILSRIFPGFRSTIDVFADSSQSLAADPYLAGVALQLPGGEFTALCQVLAVGIFAVEALMFGGLAMNRVFGHAIMPFLLLLFVWGTFVFRNEVSFFALLCILFLMARPQTSPLFQGLIVLSIGAFLALAVSGIVVRF